MTKAGESLIEGAKEALAVARGERPAARIHVNGHGYVPERRYLSMATAPKDGSPILGFEPDLLGWVICEWTGQGWWADKDAQGGGGFDDVDLIAWVPLPPSPSQQQGE